MATALIYADAAVIAKGGRKVFRPSAGNSPHRLYKALILVGIFTARL